MEFQELHTERLNLVQITEEHTESYFDIMSRDEVTKYYGMDSLKRLEDAEKMIASFPNTFNSNRGIRWAMVLKDSGAFIGTVGLNNLNAGSKRAEVGFELHPSFWNGGYTSEAVKEVINYSFTVLGLHRLGAITFPQNDASISLLKKFGFMKEGILRSYLFQNNESHDAFVFSLLKTDHFLLWTENKGDAHD